MASPSPCLQKWHSSFLKSLKLFIKMIAKVISEAPEWQSCPQSSYTSVLLNLARVKSSIIYIPLFPTLKFCITNETFMMDQAECSLISSDYKKSFITIHITFHNLYQHWHTLEYLLHCITFIIYVSAFLDMHID